MESHQDDQRVGEVDIGRKVAEITCIQSREEKAQGDITSLAISKR